MRCKMSANSQSEDNIKKNPKRVAKILILTNKTIKDLSTTVLTFLSMEAVTLMRSFCLD